MHVLFDGILPESLALHAVDIFRFLNTGKQGLNGTAGVCVIPDEDSIDAEEMVGDVETVEECDLRMSRAEEQ